MKLFNAIGLPVAAINLILFLIDVANQNVFWATYCCAIAGSALAGGILIANHPANLLARSKSET